MNRELSSSQETDLSDTSTDLESQASSVFIIPDFEDQYTPYAILVGADSCADSSSEKITEKVSDICRILPEGSDKKSIGTSPIGSILELSQNNGKIYKKIGENLYCCNEVVKPYINTPFCPNNVDLVSIINNEEEIQQEDHPTINYTVNEYGLYDAKNLISHHCNNSIQNMSSSSKHDYFSTCRQDKREIKDGNEDKKIIPSCQSKSNAALVGQNEIDNKSPNSTKNIAKQSIPNVLKNNSKDAIKSANKDEKIKSDRGSACSIGRAKTCCSNILKLPPCPSNKSSDKQKVPNREKSPSCCSILQKFKETNSSIAFHKCSSQSSNQNESSRTGNNDSVNCEGLLKRPNTAGEDKKQCKASPSNCSNVVAIKGSDEINEKGIAVIQLNKCPSEILLKTMQNDQTQYLEESIKCTDMESPSNGDLLTEPQKNFGAYYGLHNNRIKKMNVPNCIKVKVIPTDTNVVDSAVSLVKMTVNQNETIPTCKIASEDFTSMAKDFFGNIYQKTKDAMTTITSESARFLDLVRRTSQSCNTDDLSLPHRIYDDKCVETTANYSQHRRESYTFMMVDQSTSKRTGRANNQVIIESSESLIKYCSCNDTFKTTECSHVPSVDPPQSNSVFTTIKSKIFSIFREDCDVVNSTLDPKNSKASTQSELLISDSNESLTEEI